MENANFKTHGTMFSFNNIYDSVKRCKACKGKCKGTIHPRTGHEIPEGELYSSTLSLPSALGGVGGQRHAPAAFSQVMTRYPLYRACLEGCGKFRPHRDSIAGPSSPYRIAIPTTI